MKDARSDYSNIGIQRNRPLKVVICLVTLVAFFVNTFSYDLAWAAKTSTEFISGGPDRTVGPGGQGSFKELNPAKFSLPEYLGRVKDSWSPSERFTLPASRLTIVHIQDAHCNYGAQKAVAGIIEYLSAEYGINAVNLEGGAEDYDLSIFTNIADKSVREKASDYFVKAGFVNGAEYFAINNPEKVTLWGIEDTKLYIDNLRVYRNSLSHKDEIEKSLKSLSYILTNLKMKIYSKELLDFDIKYSQYKADNIEFKEYLNYLFVEAKAKEIDVKPYHNIYLLAQTLQEESAIDFRKANNERDELIDKLQKKLSKNAMEELVIKTVEFKAEKISQKDFYDYLVDKAKKFQIDLKDTPELQKYITYISAYDAMDKMKVMGEMEALEIKIKASMIENETQKDLAALSKNLAILKNIFGISMTRDDYRYYKANEDAFAIRHFTRFIEKEAPLVLSSSLRGREAAEAISESGLDRYREDISNFYEYSFKRDDAFLKNIRFHSVIASPNEVRAKQSQPRTAILVTGGFHTENLCEMFKKEGISYISIIPNFTNEEGYTSPYFKILSGEDTLNIKDALPSVIKTALAPASPFTLLSGAVADARLFVPGAAAPGGAVTASAAARERIKNLTVHAAFRKVLGRDATDKEVPMFWIFYNKYKNQYTTVADAAQYFAGTMLREGEWISYNDFSGFDILVSQGPEEKVLFDGREAVGLPCKGLNIGNIRYLIRGLPGAEETLAFTEKFALLERGPMSFEWMKEYDAFPERVFARFTPFGLRDKGWMETRLSFKEGKLSLSIGTVHVSNMEYAKRLMGEANLNKMIEELARKKITVEYRKLHRSDPSEVVFVAILGLAGKEIINEKVLMKLVRQFAAAKNSLSVLLNSEPSIAMIREVVASTNQENGPNIVTAAQIVADKYAPAADVLPTDALGKGVLSFIADPIIGLLKLSGIDVNQPLKLQGKEIYKSWKDFVEDFVVPLIEEGLMCGMGLYCGGIYSYMGIRLVFILLHAIQDRAPPEGRPRTLFEKIAVPAGVSLAAIISILPFFAVTSPLLAYGFAFTLGSISHVYANRYLTLHPESRYQKAYLGAAAPEAAQTAAAQKIMPLRHVNKNKIDGTLPYNRFGVVNVNIVDVLTSVLEKEIGYIPIISVIGSLSYALTDKGDLDWNSISDFDLRVHTVEKISVDQRQRIKVNYFKELKQRAISELRTIQNMTEEEAESRASKFLDAPGVDEADTLIQSIVMQHAGIREPATDKTYRVQLLFSTEDELFNGEVGFGAYRMTDLFFGDTKKLDSILNKVGLNDMALRTAQSYVNMLDKIKTDAAAGFDVIKPKLLKTLYQLAAIREKGREFKWLLDRYKMLETKYDEKLFSVSCEKALKDLSINEQDLVEELIKLWSSRLASTTTIAGTAGRAALPATALAQRLEPLAGTRTEPGLEIVPREQVVVPSSTLELEDETWLESCDKSRVCNLKSRQRFIEDLVAKIKGKQKVFVASLNIQNFKGEFNDLGDELGSDIGHLFGDFGIQAVAENLPKAIDAALGAAGVSVKYRKPQIYNDGKSFFIIFENIAPSDIKPVLKNIFDKTSDFKKKVVERVKDKTIDIIRSQPSKGIKHQFLKWMRLEKLKSKFGVDNFNMYAGVSSLVTENDIAGEEEVRLEKSKLAAQRLTDEADLAAKAAQMDLKAIVGGIGQRTDTVGIRGFIEEHTERARKLQMSSILLYDEYKGSMKDGVEGSMENDVKTVTMHSPKGEWETFYKPVSEIYNEKMTYENLKSQYENERLIGNTTNMSQLKDYLLNKMLFYNMRDDAKGETMVPIAIGEEAFRYVMKDMMIRAPPETDTYIGFQTGGDEFAAILLEKTGVMQIYKFDADNLGRINAVWGTKVGTRVIDDTLRLIRKAKNPDDIMGTVFKYFNNQNDGEENFEKRPIMLSPSEYTEIDVQLNRMGITDEDKKKYFMKDKKENHYLIQIPPLEFVHPETGAKYLAGPSVSAGVVEIDTRLIPKDKRREKDFSVISGRAAFKAKEVKDYIKKSLSELYKKGGKPNFKAVNKIFDAANQKMWAKPYSEEAFESLPESTKNPLGMELAGFILGKAAGPGLAAAPVVPAAVAKRVEDYELGGAAKGVLADAQDAAERLLWIEIAMKGLVHDGTGYDPANPLTKLATALRMIIISDENLTPEEEKIRKIQQDERRLNGLLKGLINSSPKTPRDMNTVLRYRPGRVYGWGESLREYLKEFIMLKRNCEESKGSAGNDEFNKIALGIAVESLDTIIKALRGRIELYNGPISDEKISLDEMIEGAITSRSIGNIVGPKEVAEKIFADETIPGWRTYAFRKHVKKSNSDLAINVHFTALPKEIYSLPPMLVQQMIINYLINAMKHNEGLDSKDIVARAIKNTWIEAKYDDATGKIVMRIWDDGPGFGKDFFKGGKWQWVGWLMRKSIQLGLTSRGDTGGTGFGNYETDKITEKLGGECFIGNRLISVAEFISWMRDVVAEMFKGRFRVGRRPGGAELIVRFPAERTERATMAPESLRSTKVKVGAFKPVPAFATLALATIVIRNILRSVFGILGLLLASVVPSGATEFAMGNLASPVQAIQDAFTGALVSWGPTIGAVVAALAIVVIIYHLAVAPEIAPVPAAALEAEKGRAAPARDLQAVVSKRFKEIMEGLRSGKRESLVGKIPGLTPEMQEAFRSGRYKISKSSDTSKISDTEYWIVTSFGSKKVTAYLLWANIGWVPKDKEPSQNQKREAYEAYEAWKKEEVLLLQVWGDMVKAKEVEDALGAFDRAFGEYGIKVKNVNTAEGIYYAMEILKLLPERLLSLLSDKKALKAIDFSAYKDGGAKFSQYVELSAEVGIIENDIQFDWYMRTGFLIHELGHALMKTLDEEQLRPFREMAKTFRKEGAVFGVGFLGMLPETRISYQQDDADEFFAENFMHYIMLGKIGMVEGLPNEKRPLQNRPLRQALYKLYDEIGAAAPQAAPAPAAAPAAALYPAASKVPAIVGGWKHEVASGTLNRPLKPGTLDSILEILKGTPDVLRAEIEKSTGILSKLCLIYEDSKPEQARAAVEGYIEGYAAKVEFVEPAEKKRQIKALSWSAYFDYMPDNQNPVRKKGSLSLIPFVQYAVREGYSNIEIPFEYMPFAPGARLAGEYSATELDKVKTLCEEHGITISIHSPLIGPLLEGKQMFEDPIDNMALMYEQIKMAGMMMGATNMVVHLVNLSPDKRFEYAKLVTYASEVSPNLKIGFENYRDKSGKFPTAAEFMTAFEAIADIVAEQNAAALKNMGIVIDTAHYNLTGKEDPVIAARLIGLRVEQLADKYGKDAQEKAELKKGLIAELHINSNLGPVEFFAGRSDDLHLNASVDSPINNFGVIAILRLMGYEPLVTFEQMKAITSKDKRLLKLALKVTEGRTDDKIIERGIRIIEDLEGSEGPMQVHYRDFVRTQLTDREGSGLTSGQSTYSLLAGLLGEKKFVEHIKRRVYQLLLTVRSEQEFNELAATLKEYNLMPPGIEIRRYNSGDVVIGKGAVLNFTDTNLKVEVVHLILAGKVEGNRYLPEDQQVVPFEAGKGQVVGEGALVKWEKGELPTRNATVRAVQANTVTLAIMASAVVDLSKLMPGFLATLSQTVTKREAETLVSAAKLAKEAAKAAVPMISPVVTPKITPALDTAELAEAKARHEEVRADKIAADNDVDEKRKIYKKAQEDERDLVSGIAGKPVATPAEQVAAANKVRQAFADYMEADSEASSLAIDLGKAVNELKLVISRVKTLAEFDEILNRPTAAPETFAKPASAGVKKLTPPDTVAITQEMIKTSKKLSERRLSGEATGFVKWLDDILAQTDLILTEEQLTEIAVSLDIEKMKNRVYNDAIQAAGLAFDFSANYMPRDGKYNAFLFRDSFALYSAEKILGRSPYAFYLSKDTFGEFTGLGVKADLIVHQIIEKIKNKMKPLADGSIPEEKFTEFKDRFFKILSVLLSDVRDRELEPSEYKEFIGYREGLKLAAKNLLVYLGSVGISMDDIKKHGIRFVDTTKTGSLVLFMEGAVRFGLANMKLTESDIAKKTDGRMFFSGLSSAMSYSSSLNKARALEDLSYPIDFDRTKGLGNDFVPVVDEVSGKDGITKKIFLFRMIVLRNELLLLKGKATAVAAPSAPLTDAQVNEKIENIFIEKGITVKEVTLDNSDYRHVIYTTDNIDKELMIHNSVTLEEIIDIARKMAEKLLQPKPAIPAIEERKTKPAARVRVTVKVVEGRVEVTTLDANGQPIIGTTITLGEGQEITIESISGAPLVATGLKYSKDYYESGLYRTTIRVTEGKVYGFSYDKNGALGPTFVITPETPELTFEGRIEAPVPSVEPKIIADILPLLDVPTIDRVALVNAMKQKATGSRTIQKILSEIESLSLEAKDEKAELQIEKEGKIAELQMALRTALLVKGLGDTEKADHLNLVYQITGVGESNMARNPIQDIKAKLERSPYNLYARSIIEEGIGTIGDLYALLDKMVEEISNNAQKNPRALLLLPQNLLNHIDKPFEKAKEYLLNNYDINVEDPNASIKIQMIDQGDSPDLVTQFGLGFEILEHVRKGKDAKPSQGLLNLIAAMVDDTENPETILKNLFSEKSVLKIRKIDWNTISDQRKAWEAVAQSL